MKSPFTISYQDVIKEQERQLAYMKKNYPDWVLRGQMHDTTATKRIAIAEKLIKMLKRHEKNPQLNLNDLFNQTINHG